MPATLGGAAVKRNPVGGSAPRPVRCSTIGMPAASRALWAGRSPAGRRAHVVDVDRVDADQRPRPASTSAWAASPVRYGASGARVPLGAEVHVPPGVQQHRPPGHLVRGQQQPVHGSGAGRHADHHAGQVGEAVQRHPGQVGAVRPSGGRECRRTCRCWRSCRSGPRGTRCPARSCPGRRAGQPVGDPRPRPAGQRGHPVADHVAQLDQPPTRRSARGGDAPAALVRLLDDRLRSLIRTSATISSPRCRTNSAARSSSVIVRAGDVQPEPLGPQPAAVGEAHLRVELRPPLHPCRNSTMPAATGQDPPSGSAASSRFTEGAGSPAWRGRMARDAGRRRRGPGGGGAVGGRG